MNSFTLKLAASAVAFLIAASPDTRATLTAAIGSKNITDNVLPGDVNPFIGSIAAAPTVENSIMVTALQSLSQLSSFDLNVGDMKNISGTSKSLQISTENQYTLASPTTFGANISALIEAGGSTYFQAFLDDGVNPAIEVYDSRDFNGGLAYGPAHYTGLTALHHTGVTPFGSAGTYNLKLVGFVDIAAAKKANFNFELTLEPSAVPDAGGTAAILGIGFLSLAAVRRRAS